MKMMVLALLTLWACIVLACSVQTTEDATPVLSVTKPTAVPNLTVTPKPAPASTKVSRVPSQVVKSTTQVNAQAALQSPYAYEVLNPSAFSQRGKSDDVWDPKNVLGSPDDRVFSLGGDGRELDVRIRVVQGPGPDLRVIECGMNCAYPGNSKDEPFDIFAWAKDGFFQFVGHSSGGVSDFDLEGIVLGDVEIVRVVSRGREGGGSPGPDIDALVALQSLPVGYSRFAVTPKVVSAPTPEPTPSSALIPDTTAIPTATLRPALTPQPVPKIIQVKGSLVMTVEQSSCRGEFMPSELCVTGVHIDNASIFPEPQKVFLRFDLGSIKAEDIEVSINRTVIEKRKEVFVPRLSGFSFVTIFKVLPGASEGCGNIAIVLERQKTSKRYEEVMRLSVTEDFCIPLTVAFSYEKPKVTEVQEGKAFGSFLRLENKAPIQQLACAIPHIKVKGRVWSKEALTKHMEVKLFLPSGQAIGPYEVFALPPTLEGQPIEVSVSMRILPVAGAPETIDDIDMQVDVLSRGDLC